MIITLWWLLVAHTITDAVLQDPKWSSMGTFKQRRLTPQHWLYWLFAHGILNGLGVFVITGSLDLMVAETGAHMLIDYGKSEGWYDVHTDQGLHLFTKVMWAWLA